MPGIYLYGWDSANSKWVKLVCDVTGKLKIDPTLILENPPTEDEAKKAATSEWCYDHWKNAAAHHTKYTNLEAQTACNLNGNLYWSCAGNSFNARNPDIAQVFKSDSGFVRIDADGITLNVPVQLFDGTTVTSVICYGNAAAEAEAWALRRITLIDKTVVDMATSQINTADPTISYEVINNSLYAYFISTSSLDTNDEIYGARITYTL